MYTYEVTYRLDKENTFTTDTFVIQTSDEDVPSFVFSYKEELERIDSYGTILGISRYDSTDERYQVHLKDVLTKDVIKQAQEESFKRELINEYYQLKEDNPYMNEDWIKDKLLHTWDNRYNLNMKEAICLLRWVFKDVK